ncbi:MAG: phosphate ABC transporter substrate-binding protein [Bacillota bacterium]
MRRFLAVLVLLVLAAAGCGGRGEKDSISGKVLVAGSTALLPLAKQAAQLFMQEHPRVTINVSGGGSFTGLQQVAAGAVDIGTSDVPAPADDPHYKGLVEHVVAVAPFVIVTHPDVGVASLTQRQLVDIFTGRITNWKQVGGADRKITVIHRPPSSGSRMVIKSIVLQGREFTANAVVMNSNGEVFNGVASTPGAIGYIDAAYLKEGVRAIKYNGVPYTKENVANGTYPIYAFERMYTRGEPAGATKAFIDFVKGDEFQQGYVEKMGFLPTNLVRK